MSFRTEVTMAFAIRPSVASKLLECAYLHARSGSLAEVEIDRIVGTSYRLLLN